MSTNDYVRFVTQQFVSYMDAPKEDRKQKKEQRRAEKEPFMNKWFGVMPLSAALFYRNVKVKEKIKLNFSHMSSKIKDAPSVVIH